MQKRNKDCKLAVNMNDVVEAGFFGEAAEAMFNYLGSMVEYGHYPNERNFLLGKLKTLEMRNVTNLCM